MALESLSRGIFSALGMLKSKRKLDEDELKEMLRSLRRALQEADFNVRQTKEITEKLEIRLREEEARPGITLQTHAMNILYTELVRLLGPSREVRPHQSTILMVGLYGNGKTTSTAKLAEWYRRRHGVRVAVIEADVHRPGAYNQLTQLLEDSTVDVYGEPDNKSAVDIVRNGLKAHAAADLVIIDTAGRHKLDEELVVELEEISAVANANERFLVIDAQVGQSAGPVAANFHDLAGVTGIVITKLDGTARGGGALSAVATTGAPVMYIGTGEKVADLEKFESDRFISRLLGMGDIRGLIDLAPEDMDEEEIGQLGVVSAPLFPAKKREAWWVVIGDAKTNSLLSLKRINLQRSQKVMLEFLAPDEAGDYNLTLFCMSDSYLGCDQEYSVPISVAVGESDDDTSGSEDE